jgi:hypothetical protein
MKGKKKPAVNSGFYETPKDTDRAAKLFELPLSLTKVKSAETDCGLF